MSHFWIGSSILKSETVHLFAHDVCIDLCSRVDSCRRNSRLVFVAKQQPSEAC